MDVKLKRLYQSFIISTKAPLITAKLTTFSDNLK